MKSRRPPAWAAAILQRFGRSPENDAIIGDITESYYGGKTAFWYCKEVLIAIAVGIFNDLISAKSPGLRAIAARWVLFSTLFVALFPIFGRCTVLVCSTGFASGLAAGRFSHHWRHLLFYTVTVHLYWIGLGPFPVHTVRLPGCSKWPVSDQPEAHMSQPACSFATWRL